MRLPPPTDADRRAHDQRIRAALGLPELRIPLSVLKKIPGVLGAKQEFSCIVARLGNGRLLVDVTAERSCSVALDIGTTNLVALLHDNVSGKDVLTRSRENPQLAFGSDILTRLHHALSGGAGKLCASLRSGVNELVADLCREAGIERGDVHALSVAGNTAMTHFFLGLDVSTIPVAPYTPVVRSPGFLLAEDAGIVVNPNAPLYVFPNAGSYVGGDIVAGVLACGIHRAGRPSVLVDVGTNAEIVIGDREWMIVGAGAAGPALEEGVTRIGKRATKGIVYDVEFADGNMKCKTFDQARPEGICGSGMVSLLYELHRAGFVDQTGALADGEYLTAVDGEKAFAVACGGGNPLAITQTEIRSFIRSKAAMFTLLLVLTRSVGIAFGDVGRVFVSGALGTGIDVKKAVGIGMMPAWPADIVTPMGNTSLAGARLLLLDAGVAAEAEALADRITYKHMHDDPEFMKEFPGALFIPHTEPALLKV